MKTYWLITYETSNGIMTGIASVDGPIFTPETVSKMSNGQQAAVVFAMQLTREQYGEWVKHLDLHENEK